jgi:hypothetical protein
LAKHEEGHVDITHKHFDDLAEKLIGKTPKEATAIYQQTSKAHDDEQDKYDHTTDHGINAPGDDSTKINLQDDDAGSKRK